MTYSTMAAQVAPITAAQISQIDLSGTYGMGEKKLPNKKISFDVYTANGGYVIRVTRGFNEDEMYVVSDNQDLGLELGKIVTHYTLSKHD